MRVCPALPLSEGDVSPGANCRASEQEGPGIGVTGGAWGGAKAGSDWSPVSVHSGRAGTLLALLQQLLSEPLPSQAEVGSSETTTALGGSLPEFFPPRYAGEFWSHRAVEDGPTPLGASVPVALTPHPARKGRSHFLF